jgi:uncharacterized protein YbcC (UPF0753/DUF2309 family)
MMNQKQAFSEEHTLHELKHYLPAQAPLKDFIHHNTLHAFQHLNFAEAMQKAKEIFGYKTTLSLKEYRNLYQQGQIKDEVIKRIVTESKGEETADNWIKKLHHVKSENLLNTRVGRLRQYWKKVYKLDLDNQVHPLLFRVLCSYLDQGIAMWPFPVEHKGFLASLRMLEKNSQTSFFKTERAKKLLLHSHCNISALLHILVGEEAYFEQYLFDQQFCHPGWSGMVATIESNPDTLIDKRYITLHDFIAFELLLEIDTLDYNLSMNWKPISEVTKVVPLNIFDTTYVSEEAELIDLWQKAYEWTYYNSVLLAIQTNEQVNPIGNQKSFQAMFCIDDRECSIRRHIETFDEHCETFGTPGFFGVEFYYKPEHGKFITKLCPAPVSPKYLIKEIDSTHKHDKDMHLTKHSHSLFSGWLISQTLGFWSAFRLFLNLFKPSMSPATATSLRHMDQFSKLTIEHKSEHINQLQVGFTIAEMATRIEGLLRSIGLISNFAPLVYIIGHGSSSVNNPHYAAYDCGACSGRPGSVNARVASFMANHPMVRNRLQERGINIPTTTKFVAGLHDTTRDDMVFYDEEQLHDDLLISHAKNKITMQHALDENAKERSRRFEVIDTHKPAAYIHQKIQNRSVSLFEPRPELNHATNTLCIIGKRDLTKNIFLDRRAFMNSYNHTLDSDGKYLLNILKAAAPVCGGINLEYYFSRVDNSRLGAGTKLPHNVMGLIGVANGIDGDLRPGLPTQMIEVHDPIRLLMVVEHYPDVILHILTQSKETNEWFANNWINLVAVHPETRSMFVYKSGAFYEYRLPNTIVPVAKSVDELIQSSADNIAVHFIKN